MFLFWAEFFDKIKPHILFLSLTDKIADAKVLFLPLSLFAALWFYNNMGHGNN
jgi:hypothetical protein